MSDDVTEIANLVYRYAYLIDTGDLEGVAALFDNATWRSAADGTVRRGRDEVREVYAKVRLYGTTPRTKHLITNVSIDVDPGADEASGHCYFTVLQSIDPGDPIRPILSGQYVDRFRRAGGRWGFSDRLFVVDLVGDLSRHFA